MRGSSKKQKIEDRKSKTENGKSKTENRKQKKDRKGHVCTKIYGTHDLFVCV